MARHLTSLGALDAPASNTAIAQPDLTRNPSAAGIGLLVLAKAFPPSTALTLTRKKCSWRREFLVTPCVSLDT
jgi:hypothetical protein